MPTLTRPERIRGSGGGTGHRGGGGWGGGDSGDTGGFDRRSTPSVLHVGIIAGLVSITAFFAALAVAFGITMQGHPGLAPVELPQLLWMSTGLLAASSATLELSRKELRFGRTRKYSRTLGVTVVLGFGFLILQLLSWRELAASGVLLGANPRASVLYLFTGAHGLHVLGGLISMGALLVRARGLSSQNEQVFRSHRRAGSVVAIYWHFMGVLWLSLFALLHAWRA